MKKDIFINIDDFKSIFEVEIENIPNQEFNLNINEKTYTIELRELNERIYITISRDNEILCLNSNIELRLNIALYITKYGLSAVLAISVTEPSSITSSKDCCCFLFKA